MPHLSFSEPAATRGLGLGALVLALAGAAALLAAPPAAAVPPPGAETAWAAGPAGEGHRPPDPAARADRMVDRWLMGVDEVSADQRARLKALATETLREMRGTRQAGRELRQRQLALLAQPSLDSAAYERLTQERAAHHEQATRRIAQAQFQAAQVLTPAQRAQVAARQVRHEGRPHDWRGGHDRAPGPRL